MPSAIATLGKELRDKGVGPDVRIDPSSLMTSRLLVQASSGGGKSFGLRRILEETHGAIQQIVIDPEGEFHTLREKYDFVLAGQKGGDCPATVKSAGLLARRLLELHTSAIIDIYDLPKPEKLRFVRLFIESMMDAPRELWHPVMVVVDEAHHFCPEGAAAESSAAVIDLCSRGRKRGFCPVLATQRIAKLSKDAAAELKNKIIGGCTLDLDIDRASKELGLRTEQKEQLKHLRPGEFFVYGPAFPGIVGIVKVKVGPVVTTHPKPGEIAPPPTPPRDKVKRILSQLADLPGEAAAEAKTVAELRQQIAELKRELTKASLSPLKDIKQQVAELKPEVLEKIKNAAYREGWNACAQKDMAPMQAEHAAFIKNIEDHVRSVRQSLDDLAVKFRDPRNKKMLHSKPVAPPPAIKFPHPRQDHGGDGPCAACEPAQPRQATDGDQALSDGELRILGALAWFEAIGMTEVELVPMATMANYAVSGNFKNLRGGLRTKGLVEYTGAGLTKLTAAGRAAAPAVDRPGTTEEMHKMVMAQLNESELRLMRPLLKVYPRALTLDELAEAAGYEVSGNFKNLRGGLRTKGFADYPGQGLTRAHDRLFIDRR